MSQVAIILNPSPDKRNSPYGFSAPKNKAKSNKNGGLELVSVWLTPGTNFVPEEDWSLIANHPNNKSEIERCTRRNILQVTLPQPDLELTTNSSLDFANIDDVKELILASNDLDWLRRSLAKDNRPQVDAWCQQRINEIEAIKNKQ